MKSQDRYFCISFLMIAAWSVVVVVFSNQYSRSVVSDDYFRHLNFIILPLVSGQGDISLLWLNHHATPLLHLHQMFAIFVLDGDLTFDAYVGAVLHLSVACVIGYKAFRYFLQVGCGPLWSAVLAGFLGGTVTALVVSVIFAWPLVSLMGYFLLIGVLVAALASRVVETPDPRPALLVLTAFAGMASIILHSSFGSIFSAAAVVVLAFQGSVKRKRSCLILALCLIAIIIVCNIFISSLKYKSYLEEALYDDQTQSLIVYVIRNIYQYAIYFGKALCNAVYGIVVSSQVLPAQVGQGAAKGVWLAHSLAFLLALLWALNPKHRLSFPAVLMVSALLMMLAVGVFRTTRLGFEGIASTRYVLSFKIAGSACLWVVCAFVLDRARRRHPGAEARALPGLVIVFVLLLGAQTVSTLQFFRTGEAFRSANAVRELATVMFAEDPANSFSLRRIVAGNNRSKVYRPVILWLQQQEKSVFSPGYRPEPELAGYRQARGVFEGAESTTRWPESAFEETCIRMPPHPGRRAWRLSLTADERRGRIYAQQPGSNLRWYFVLPGSYTHYGLIEPDRPLKLCWPEHVRVEVFETADAP